MEHEHYNDEPSLEQIEGMIRSRLPHISDKDLKRALLTVREVPEDRKEKPPIGNFDYPLYRQWRFETEQYIFFFWRGFGDQRIGEASDIRPRPPHVKG